MLILPPSVLRGQNIYYTDSVIVQEIDMGLLQERTSAEAGRTFARRFVSRFSSLRYPPSDQGMPPDFVERLSSKEGVPLMEVLFIAILRVEASMACAMNRFRQLEFAQVQRAVSPERHLFVWQCLDAGVSRRTAKVALLGIAELLPARLRKGLSADESFETAYQSLWAYARRQGLTYNSGILVDALEKRGIPWEKPFASDRWLIRAGQGRFQRYSGSAVTEATSRVACFLAQDKQMTNTLLRDAGIPAPMQYKVKSAEAALAAAEKIGYPVVLKPLYGNTGKGVSVLLNSPEEVAHGFLRAAEHGPSVAVETFIAGVDHRLLVIDDRFVAATQRIPPFVIGDGKKTIAELIDLLNRDPRRDGFTLLKITPGEELDRLLALSGYKLKTKLAKGEKFLLRRTANYHTGGTTVDVTDLVHPDNRALAIRAAQILGLNLAGVDLITADIQRSWREVGGAIIEVNNCPGLDLHTRPAVGEPREVGGAVVASLFPPGEEGRVPVALVAAGRSSGAVAEALEGMLRSAGTVVGVVGPNGWRVGDESSGPTAALARDAVRAVLRDRCVEAMIRVVTPREVSRRGLVHDRCEATALRIPKIRTDKQTKALGVIVRATRGKFAAGTESAAALLSTFSVEPQRIVLVARNGGSPAVRRHLSAGGQAVVTAMDQGQRVIVVVEGNETLVCVPEAALPTSGGAAAAKQVENVMYAMALGCALGLGGDALRAAAASLNQDHEAKMSPGTDAEPRENAVVHAGELAVAVC